MDKTTINALVQSIERSLHLIDKSLFSIKQYQSPPHPPPPKKKKKLARICLKNHAVLPRHCYTFTLVGQKSWWGATGSGGRTAKCAANEDETWLWPWQYHLSNVFLSRCWSNEYCVGFSVTFWHGRGKKTDPDKYDGVPAHLDLAISALYAHNLSFPTRHHWKGFKLSESDTKGRHFESGNLKMYNRNERAKP